MASLTTPRLCVCGCSCAVARCGMCTAPQVLPMMATRRKGRVSYLFSTHLQTARLARRRDFFEREVWVQGQGCRVPLRDEPFVGRE